MRVDARGGCRIETPQQAVQRAGALRLTAGKAVAQGLIAGRAGEQAIEKRPEVEARASRHNRQSPSFRDSGNRIASQAGILPGSKDGVRVQDIDQMVWYPAAPGLGKLGGTDIEPPVDLERVAVDDFTLKRLRQYQCQLAFSRSGRTGNRNQRACHSVLMTRGKLRAGSPRRPGGVKLY